MNRIALKTNKIKGAIFDIDGILVDTEYFQWLGWIEALKPYDKTLSKQAYFKYAGKQGPQIESELLKDLNLHLAKRTLLVKKESLLINWFHEKSLQLMPYAREAIEFFLEKNLKVAAASGSPKDEALLKLEKTSLLPLLQSIISGSDVTRGKPFPDTYVAAVASLKLKPETCLAFEDTQYGVESAKSAGLYCFAIPNEFSQEQDFSKADGIFENLKEAITWITLHN